MDRSQSTAHLHVLDHSPFLLSLRSIRAVAVAVWGGHTRGTYASDGSGVWQDEAITFESKSSFCTWSSRSLRYGGREGKVHAGWGGCTRMPRVEASGCSRVWLNDAIPFRWGRSHRTSSSRRRTRKVGDLMLKSFIASTTLAYAAFFGARHRLEGFSFPSRSFTDVLAPSPFWSV